MLGSFLSGAIFMGCVAITLHFLRLWRRTGDRLFAYFLCAFAALALERVALAVVRPQDEFEPFVYLVRMAAFGLIIAAVIDKNRQH
jgi:ABC-type Co2+ transport system permease subunit